ncbi:MAG: CBS domain-containing protein [Mesorhizobium sp.]
MLVEQLAPLTSARLTVVDLEAPLHIAAVSFLKPGIGLVVACHGNGEAAGVLSKSDLVRHLALAQADLTNVSALMSSPFFSCTPDDELHSIWEIMSARNLKNAPVLGAGEKPIGVLDIRDAMKALFEQEELQEKLLADYIAGIGYQ